LVDVVAALEGSAYLFLVFSPLCAKVNHICADLEKWIRTAHPAACLALVEQVQRKDLSMAKAKGISITLFYDDWGEIAGALGEYATQERRVRLLMLAAFIERSIGNSATAMCVEAAAEEMKAER